MTESALSRSLKSILLNLYSKMWKEFSLSAICFLTKLFIPFSLIITFHSATVVVHLILVILIVERPTFVSSILQLETSLGL